MVIVSYIPNFGIYNIPPNPILNCSSPTLHRGLASASSGTPAEEEQTWRQAETTQAWHSAACLRLGCPLGYYRRFRLQGVGLG